MPPIGEYSAFQFEIDSDWDLHAHTYSELETRKQIFEAHQNLINVVADIELNHFNLYFKIEKATLSDLGIKLASPENTPVESIGIKEDDLELHFRELEDEVRGMTDYEGDKKITPDEVESVVESNIDKAREYLVRIANGN